MIRLVIVRIGRGLITVAIVAVVIFLLTSVTGDPVLQLLPPDHTRAEYDALRHSLGYDRPLWEQFISFISRIALGNFGTSTLFSQNVTAVIAAYLPISISLAGISLAIGGTLAIVAGFVVGFSKSRRGETLVTSIATLGGAVPPFAVGMLLIVIFAVQLRVLPSGGWGTPQQAILPVATLSLTIFAAIARIARSSMRERVDSEFVVLARTKGLSGPSLFLRHATRPSLPPVLGYVAILAGSIFSGNVVTEAVFGIPGLGSLAVQSVEARDQNLVIGIVMFSALLFVAFNIAGDLVVAALDPRVRLRTRSAR